MKLLKNFEETFNDVSAKLDLPKNATSSFSRRKTTRSWEKAKWLLVTEKETSKFFAKIKLYQADFSLALLTVIA